MYIWKNSIGYDGIDYYLIARDPFLKGGFYKYIDNPPRRC